MAKAILLDGSETNENQTSNPVGLAEGITQSALQGLSFGTADEIQGFAKGLYSKFVEGKDFSTAYNETVDDIRSDLKSFREQEPLYAYGSEIVGSLPTALLGGAGLAKAGVGAVKGAGAMGALYGAGATDSNDPVDRAIGGTVGGLTGGTFQKIAPYATESAKKLIEKGVPVTVGQAVGGGLKKVEEALTSVPFVGSSITKAMQRSKKGFDKAVFEEVLDPLKKIGVNPKKSLENVSGRELYSTTENIISNAYEKILPKLKMPNQAVLQSKFDDVILNEAEVLPESLQKTFLNKLDQIVYRKFKDGKIDGNSFKKAVSQLRGEVRKFRKSQEPSNIDMANSFKSVENAMIEVLKETNPSEKVALDLIDQSFKRLLPVEKAVISAEGGEFTANQLLRAIKSGDPSLRKKSFAKGEANMQPIAEAGQNVLSQRLANSGTADRSMLGTLALGGGLAIDPVTTAIGAGLSTSAYSPLGTNLVRNITTKGIAPIMGRGSPFYGGLLGSNSEDANFFGLNRR